MWCKDPFLVYLKQFGYNAIRLPKADVRPLQLLAKDGKEFNRLGEIHHLLVAGNAVSLLKLLENTPTASISGQRTGDLSLGIGLSILGMDACLMNMIEIAYQVRGSVEFTAGSEETEPGDGWPYDKIVAELVKNPDMPARELTKVIVRTYLASYAAGDGVTQSALDLSRADRVGTACDRLAEVLLENLEDDSVRNALLTARSRVQSYEVFDYVDLADLAELILDENLKAPIANACADVIQAVTHGFVIKSGHKGRKMAHSHGVSIYFPWRGISPLYTKLDFSRDTAWNELLKRFQSGTERPTKKGGQRGL
ncbi:MAG TPA: clostripain-related cysteine peptidase [Geobacteraceae bacterium]|nr:clostripain-related cysteine peptidase [Geobacteraceae bacterium]